MSIKLYGDLTSQPFRAVLSLLEIEKAKVGKFEVVYLKMSKKQHKTKEYLAINPMGKVPSMQVIREGKPDINMNESHAMMKYICASKRLADHWYPTSGERDYYLQQRMDQYLDWHHQGIR